MPHVRLGVFSSLLVLAPLGLAVEPVPTLSWMRQFGTPATDYISTLTTNSSGLYVAGSTNGSLAQPVAGIRDGFLAKFDFAGNTIWTRQFGIPGSNYTYVLGSTATDTAVYAAGFYEFFNSMRQLQAFVRKYDNSGALLWVRDFIVSPEVVQVNAMTADDTGVYICGGTSGSLAGTNSGQFDAFVRKYDFDGNVLWTRQFGTPYYDSASALAHDASSIYVAGSTSGALSGTSAGLADVFVRKYDPSGNVIWTRQTGTNNPNFATGLAVSGDAVYFSGWFNPPGANNAQAGRFDTFGNLLWIRRFGVSAFDFAYGAAADATGLYIAGTTSGSLAAPFAGYQDGYIRKYSPLGEVAWTVQFGGPDADVASSIVAHGGAIYVGGGVGAVNGDAVLRKYSFPPAQLFAALTAALTSMDLPTGVANSLQAKLRHAAKDLPSCVDFKTFTNEVNARTKKGLTAEQAAELLARVQEITISVPCTN